MRKESAERGVRGLNLKDDKPVGAWNIKSFGAKEDKDGAATASTTGTESVGAWSATMFSSSGQGAGLGGHGFSSVVCISASYTTQKQPNNDPIK